MDEAALKVLLISPYHTGSHKAWAEGWQACSAHEVRLLTLEGQFWKWRMQGGAVTLAQRFLAMEFVPDRIVATDMLDVSLFMALTREKSAGIPVSLYMHENQLTYPLKKGKMTAAHLPATIQQFAFVNYVSMLTADSVSFNSHYHKDAFFSDLPVFLNHFPDHPHTEQISILEKKSRVLPVGINLARLDGGHVSDFSAPPLVIWNQRWEYDKNPPQFFKVLYQLANEDIPFRVAICGENFSQNPDVFLEAQEKLGERVIHFGYANSERYKELLWESAVTASTANHEFFGISILEAAYCHTFPVLPRRLSYPELIPADVHDAVFYDNFHGLLTQLRWALTYPKEAQTIAGRLSADIAQYDWQHVGKLYDNLLIK